MEQQEHTQELARDLGFFDAYTLGVGTMIGAGIFVLPSIAAANAGPASMISFAIGGFVSLLAALSLAELATGMPRAGGSYYYVNQAMGTFFGSIVGWGMWTGLMFATAFYMLGFGQYMTYFFGDLPVQYAALVMAALLVFINFRGVKETSVLQNVIVAGLIGLIIVFVSVGVFDVDMETLRPFNPQGWGAVAALSATLYVSFIGFEVIATSAEEIKRPGRNLPLAMIASVLTPTVLYVLVMFVSTGVLPIPELADSKIPVADVATEFLGEFGTLMMVIGAVLATVSSANASILSAARVNFAMGRDRILTNWLNEVHKTFHTPYRAIIVTGVVILVMIGVGVGVETLADVASFSYLITYALVHVAVIVMRRAAPPDYEPDFRIPGLLYPIVPLVGLVSCLVIVSQMRPIVLLIGTGMLALGAGWYALYARKKAARVSFIGEAIVAEAARPAAAEEAYRVVVPVANPATQGMLLRLAAAAAKQHPNGEVVAVNIIEVPPQTALAQNLQFERERVAAQQQLLDAAAEIAQELGVALRTRAILARRASDAILQVLREEGADRLFMGWKGRRKRREFILGSTIDPVVEQAPCEVSLLKVRAEQIGEVVVLAGGGPITPLAAGVAADIAASNSAQLTLLNIQQPEPVTDEDSGEVLEPQEAGERTIAEVARKAGLEEGSYTSRVVVSEQIEAAIMEAVEDYQTIFVGATRTGVVKQALFGSIPEKVGEQASGTVVMVNKRHQPRTIIEAIAERLGMRR
jgi:basic amino acid/polyamine antiporter, APA family